MNHRQSLPTTKLWALGLAAMLTLFAGAPRLALAHSDPGDDGLIDGGGNEATDCISKFQTGLEANYPPPPKPKQKDLACIDGDLACDADGLINGECEFSVGLCLNDDADYVDTGCIPADLAPGAVVVKNKPSAPDPDLTALQSEVDTLLGGSGLSCASPGAPPGNCFTCTANQVPVTVSLAEKGGKKTVKVTAETVPTGPNNKPVKDSDKLKLRCLDCEAASAWEHINQIVFQQGCANFGCHSGPSPFAGLNLDADEIGLDGVYNELVSEAPSASGAAALGMARVLPGDPNLESISSSLLVEKLRNTQSELDAICAGGGEGINCLGGPMPPGIDTYSTGKVELIKAWIAGGAPTTGWPDGTTCGEPEDIWTPAEPLAPPPSGQGFQIHFQAPVGFEVAPGTEYEGCQWIQVPPEVTSTMYITKTEIHANTGTHHIIVYDDVADSGPPASPTSFDPDDALCNNQFGLKSFQFGSQDPDATEELPPNVSFAVQPGEVFGINTHYTNPYNVPIYPEVWFNFWGTTTPTSKTAINIFPGDLTFSVPPGGGPDPGYPGCGTSTCEPQDATDGLGNLSSYTHFPATAGCFYFIMPHQHRRGVEFRAWTQQPSSWNDPDGLLFASTDWDHPVEYKPFPRLMLTQNQKIWFQCLWDNGVKNDVTRRCQPTAGPSCALDNEYVCFTNADCGAGTTGFCQDCPLDFGFLSEDEMCFMPGFYYAANAGPTCPY